ncbi:MAG: hypothetical protein ACP5MV_03560 [Candidatus Parvarchaeum sp.]
MKISYIAAILILLSVFSVSLVHAQISVSSPPPISSSSNSLLSGLSSGNSYIYAGFFAIVMFIIFAIALDRTQLSSGRIAISFIFALITFFLLYTDNTLLHFFLNTFIILAFIALILGMLAAVKSPRSIRLIGLVVALFLIIILFENDTGLTNSVNSALHINILSILPLVFGIITVVVFIILLLRGVKTHSNIVLRVILLFIVFLLIALLIPGFASFLFSPIVLVPLFVAILLVIFLIRRWGKHYPKPSKEDKKAQKEANVQKDALSSIAKRKQANEPVLKEYQDLLKKGNLTPQEQLRMAQLKNKLANEAWKNVADRVDLTKVQYSNKQLSNNKDLQKLTGFFSKDQALRDLKSKAKSNYKLSWSQKKALKKEQKQLNSKNKFITNVGNSQAGDLFDLANAVNKGAIGEVPSDKTARKIFEKRLSKETRQKDVSSLLNERNKLLDPNLNLSETTRRKLIAKLDKKLNKISGKIVPDQLKKQKAEQQRREMLEEQAKLAEAARQEQQRREMLEEQAKLAEAARQQAEHDRLIKEQKKAPESTNKVQQASAPTTNSGVVGPNTAFDKRLKPILWFSHKSPVDENGNLDVRMQNEIETRGLMDRRENLVSLINSGKLSGRQLKDAKNELNRIDYRLKKYGRDIHR